MKKYRTTTVLRPTANHPAFLPPNHVAAITAIAKKNQKGLPKGTCRTRDNNNAIDTSAVAKT
jgi:hypothetical protein